MSTEYQEPAGVMQIQDIEAIPVHIESSNATPVRPASPEFGTCMTWNVDTLTNMGQPVRILTQRYRRTKGRIIIPSLGPIGTPLASSGVQNAPAANTQIGNISAASIIPAEYMIYWTVSLSGTPGANEVDNFQLRIGAATFATSSNPGAIGEFPQAPFGPVFLSTSSVAVRSGSAVATAGSVYTIALSIVPVIPSTGFATVVLNSKQEPLMQPTPVGMMIAAPTAFDWENRQPCYAVLTPGSNGPVQISVLDQSYEET